MSLPTSLDQLATPLAAAAVRGTIILAGALLLSVLLRRRSAAARHAVWSGAVAMQLVVLALSIAGPRWRVEAPSVVADAVSPILAMPADARASTPAPNDASRVATERAITSSAPAAAPRTIEAASQLPTTPVMTGAPVGRRTLLLALWLAGAAFVLLRLAVGTAVVAALARRGARVDDGSWLSLTQRLANSLGIERPLTLMRGTRVGVPITWGIVYPVVLLPDDADAWPEERRRFVLLHEMAHVKRLDALTQLVGQVVLAVFWFNPLVWVATRRMQLEREHACDDYVLTHGTAPTMYAEELLAMVRRLGTPEQRGAQPAFAALAMARRSEFEGRMLSILDPVLDRHPLSGRRALVAAVAALLVVVPLAALQPYRAEARPVAGAPVPRPVTRVAAADTIRDERGAPPVPAAPATTPAMPAARVAPTPPAAPSVAPLAAGTYAHTPGASTAPLARLGSIGAWGSTPSTPVGPVALPAPAAPTASGGATTMPAPPAPARVSKYDCSRARLNDPETQITSIHSDTDRDGGGPDMIEYYTLANNRCAQAIIVGTLTYSPDESDITDMAHGSHGVFRERTTTDDRELVIDPVNGTLVRSYRRDGRTAAFDDDARRWFSTFLPKVLAEAGLNVKPRVARWYREGGTDRALHGISTLTSGSGKRSHYLALLDQPLSRADMERVVQQGTRAMSGSSGDMRSFLTRAAPVLRSPASIPTLMTAINSISSSGDRTAVLRTFGDTDNRDLLLAIVRASRDVPSSGDKTGLLRFLTSRALGGGDRALREAWFDAVRSIASSGDMTNALVGAIPYAGRSDEVALEVIESARRVASSGDRTNVLVRLARSRPLASSALSDAYLRAAREIPSSGDMRHALEAIAP